MAVAVDPLRAGDGRVATFGRDGGTCAQVPDALAKRIGSETPVTDDPARHVGQTAEQPRGKRQFMRLARSEGEGDRAATAVGVCSATIIVTGADSQVGRWLQT